MASADDYPCINDDILILTSVYCQDGIKFSCNIYIYIISVLFLKGEICQKKNPVVRNCFCRVYIVCVSLSSKNELSLQRTSDSLYAGLPIK